MSNQYRVDIWKNSVLLCSAEIVATRSEEFLQIVLEKFPDYDGFEKKVFVAKSEKRILESSEEGIRVLARQINYEEMTTND